MFRLDLSVGIFYVLPSSELLDFSKNAVVDLPPEICEKPRTPQRISGTFCFLHLFSLKNFFRNGTTSRGLFQMTTFMYASSQNESSAGRML